MQPTMFQQAVCPSTSATYHLTFLHTFALRIPIVLVSMVIAHPSGLPCFKVPAYLFFEVADIHTRPKDFISSEWVWCIHFMPY